VGCRAVASCRRNTAGSWERRVERLGELGCFGEGHGMVEYRKSLVQSASEVVHRGRIRSRTSDRCASYHSPPALSRRQGQHTILFGFIGVRQFIIRSFYAIPVRPQTWQVRRCNRGVTLDWFFLSSHVHLYSASFYTALYFTSA